MDAALDETFLPRDAQGAPKMGEGNEEHRVKDQEGVEGPGSWGDRGSSLSRERGGERGSFLLISELCVEDLAWDTLPSPGSKAGTRQSQATIHRTCSLERMMNIYYTNEECFTVVIRAC